VKFNDLVRISVRQIIRHRRSYWGVVLAITLGIAGLITVIMVSRDFKKNLSRDLDLIGGVTVVKAYFDNHLTSRPMVFSARTLGALHSLPGVQEVSAIALKVGKTILTTGRYYSFPITASDEAFWKVRNFWASNGSLFGRDTVTGRKRECVLGESLAEKIFGHSKVAGLSMEINNEPYRVIGVLGGITDSALAGTAYLPITTLEDRFSGPLMTDCVYLRCATLEDVAPVAGSIIGVVQTYQSNEELRVEVLWEGLKRVQQIFWWTEFFVYVAIGVTLILGGVGIWNVMMAAVRSRTREIGLKKAVGAKDVDIFIQFLSEAMILSLGASLLGIIIGRLSVECFSYFIGSQLAEYLFLICIVLGLSFGTLLGIGAGLFPSIRASRMDVVDAVRYE